MHTYDIALLYPNDPVCAAFVNLCDSMPQTENPFNPDFALFLQKEQEFETYLLTNNLIPCAD